MSAFRDINLWLMVLTAINCFSEYSILFRRFNASLEQRCLPGRRPFTFWSQNHQSPGKDAVGSASFAEMMSLFSLLAHRSFWLWCEERTVVSKTLPLSCLAKTWLCLPESWVDLKLLSSYFQEKIRNCLKQTCVGESRRGCGEERQHVPWTSVPVLHKLVCPRDFMWCEIDNRTIKTLLLHVMSEGLSRAELTTGELKTSWIEPSESIHCAKRFLRK